MKNIAAALAFAVCAGSPVLAADFTPAPHMGGMVLDQDTDAGKYSSWHFSDLAGMNAIRTTLRIHRLGSDPRWAPSFTISLKAKEDVVQFQLNSLSRQPPAEIHLIHYAGSKMVDDFKFNTTIALDETLNVAIGWTPDGVMTVTLGNGESHAMELGGQPDELHFADSTGEIEYNPLAIGHAGGP